MPVTTAHRTITIAEALNEAIRLEMRADPKIIIMGEDIAGGADVTHLEDDEAWGGVMSVTKGLVHEFGRERVLDTPISEAAFVGAAVGAAATGLRPIAELMFCGFLGSCLDSLLNQGSKLRYMFGGKATVPVTIRTMIGGGFRAAAQHAQTLYPMFASIPGLKVVAPSNAADAKGLLTASLRDDDPVIFCEHIIMYTMKGDVPSGDHCVPIGKAAITKKGEDVTLLGVSMTAVHALTAAKTLKEQNIDAEVIDLRTISPLDEETILESVKKTGRLVIVDESNPLCGLASHIGGVVASQGFEYLKAPVGMVTAPHSPVPFSPVLEDAYLPNPEKIVASVKKVFSY
ncbi:MAG: alpha-ketoacid dehydrogenase subunit beta [Acidobacteriia bacterium]|jgi:pyruvate dehydrogenase E1 component beta subunit|nr:alpha-ketoacid dehydrogenase subunit beta [Terriglobia bacterium]